MLQLYKIRFIPAVCAVNTKSSFILKELFYSVSHFLASEKKYLF